MKHPLKQEKITKYGLPQWCQQIYRFMTSLIQTISVADLREE